MIVDDNRAFMPVAALVLERDGVAVAATTTSSAEALECLERLRPDVMLVDIELGGESGFDLARAITSAAVGGGPGAGGDLISAHDEHDVATAAGRIAERGLGRPLATPATAALGLSSTPPRRRCGCWP